MSIVKWFKKLFSKEERSEREMLEESGWCNQQVFLKVMETGKPCSGFWKDDKYVVEVCDE